MPTGTTAAGAGLGCPVADPVGPRPWGWGEQPLLPRARVGLPVREEAGPNAEGRPVTAPLDRPVADLVKLMEKTSASPAPLDGSEEGMMLCLSTGGLFRFLTTAERTSWSPLPLFFGCDATVRCSHSPHRALIPTSTSPRLSHQARARRGVAKIMRAEPPSEGTGAFRRTPTPWLSSLSWRTAPVTIRRSTPSIANTRDCSR